MHNNPPASVPTLLLDRARTHPDTVAFARRRSTGGEGWTYGRLAATARALGTAFLDRGLEPGDRVALVADTCADWFAADLAIAGTGAVGVPRGSDTSLPELLAILRHAEPRWAVVEKAGTAAELEARRAELPFLETIYLLTPANGPWENLEGLAATTTPDPERFDAAVAALGPESLLTVVYTSGTTGDPRGVMLTHGNVVANVVRLPEVCRIHPGEPILSLLPAWHMFERTVDYYVLSRGCTVTFTDRRRLRGDLTTVQPALMVSVPRVWEMIHDGIVHRLERLEGWRGRLARWLAARLPDRGRGSLGLLERLLLGALGGGLRRRIAGAFGGNLRCAVSGGGALRPELDAFFVGAGVPLFNGYGLTETGPVVCARRRGRNRPGGVGPLLTDTEVRIKDREGRELPVGAIGVIHVRGPQVMKGYYRNPAATARVMDADGWFDTGDLGRLDELGELAITGRAKETIVLAGGENVEPAPLEAALLTSPLIRQVVVLGQDSKRLAALVVPDEERLAGRVPRERWEPRDGILVGDAPRAALRAELERLGRPGAGFRPCERIGPFHVLAEGFTEANGLLTATQKVRRHKVTERFGDLFTER